MRTYYENKSSVDPLGSTAKASNGASQSTPSSARAGGWDFDIFNFDITVPTVTTPSEGWKEEVNRYFLFEGGRGALDDDLLIKWKVCYELEDNGVIDHSPLDVQNLSGILPTVALVARDILAIPATSVAVERVFSKSRHICTDLRSSLKAETVREALLTKVWIRGGLLGMVQKPTVHPKHGSVELLQ